MQIQSGKLYENRTWKYLYPCLKCYGPELMDFLSSFFKLGVGIGDFNIPTEGNSIFILISTSIPLASNEETIAYKNKVAKFLDWIKYQYYYITDYVFDINNKHMIVLKVPFKHNSTYINFTKGKYSLMYDSKQINQYFSNVNIPNKTLQEKINSKIENTRKILTKNKDYVQNFVDIVNRDFDANITVEHYLGEAELDYPPKFEEEIFNYRYGT